MADEAHHGRLTTLRRYLRRRLRRRDNPSTLTPDYLHLHTLARGLRGLLAGDAGAVLDLGCGDSPYRRFIPEATDYVRLDLDADCRPDIVADALHLPVRTGSFDLVLCTQLAEFAGDPGHLVAECARVLRPGGRIVLSAPFFWPNQPFESDNFRFTLGAMRRLFRGFSDITIIPNGNRWQTLLQVASCCVWNTVGVVGVAFFVAVNTVGRLMDVLPSDSLLTTGYTVSAVKR